MSDVARILKEARDQGRLTALDFAQGIFDDFIELHGDRNFRDDGAVIGGIGRLNGQAVTVVGIQKGKNLQDNLNRNFGQPHFRWHALFFSSSVHRWVVSSVKAV